MSDYKVKMCVCCDIAVIDDEEDDSDTPLHDEF